MAKEADKGVTKNSKRLEKRIERLDDAIGAANAFIYISVGFLVCFGLFMFYLWLKQP